MTDPYTLLLMDYNCDSIFMHKDLALRVIRPAPRLRSGRQRFRLEEASCERGDNRSIGDGNVGGRLPGAIAPGGCLST